MAAQSIDGRGLAREVKAALLPRLERLKGHKVFPKLSIILVGEDPASLVYIQAKRRACTELNIASEEEVFPSTVSEAVLTKRIEALNADPLVSGILVQLPLPPEIAGLSLLDRISPEKDVDGLTSISMGRLVRGLAGLRPCTPEGVIYMLNSIGALVPGVSALVVGRSNLVGLPLSLLLAAPGVDATVTLCHSKTRALAQHCREADIIVAAAGRAGLIQGDMVREGAVVIDVGIHRLPNGQLCGDVDQATVSERALWLSPVPGGVGPLTVAMLLSNVIKAAELQQGLWAGAV